MIRLRGSVRSWTAAPRLCRAHQRHAHPYRLALKQAEEEASQALNERAAASAFSEDPWRIELACVIERLPTLVPDPEPWEEAYAELKDQLDLEQCRQYPEDFFEKAMVYEAEAEGEDEGTGGADADADDTDGAIEGSDTIGAAVDDDDGSPEGAMPFAPASRRTPSDDQVEGERTSLERRLTQSLFLVVDGGPSQPFADDPAFGWRLPQAPRDDTEIDRNTGKILPMPKQAERAILAQLGGNPALFLVSNAPVGCLEYEFSEAQQKQTGKFGAKVFFYRFHMYGGELSPDDDSGIDNFEWLTAAEVANKLHPKYHSYVGQILAPLGEPLAEFAQTEEALWEAAASREE